MTMPTQEMMYQFFAITTRGLEAISAAEIAALPGVVVDEVGYRMIFATCQEVNQAWFHLRTVDDVFLHLVTWQNVLKQRSALSDLQTWSARLNLERAMQVVGQVRKLKHPLTFSVTVNFVGQRNYSTPEIKKACADGIASRHWCRYVEDDDEADLNVRVFILHDQAMVGVRLGSRPLYRRVYKQTHLPGSLKPSVAAALLRLGEVLPGTSLLDPCCGAGTILIEASVGRALSLGGDVEPTATAAARSNVQAAGVAVPICQWDARSLPLPNRSVDRVVSNLPWGREVATTLPVEALYKQVSAEMRRVLAPGGKIVLLTSLPACVHIPDMRLVKQLEISLFGQNPTIMIWADRFTSG